MRESGVFLPDRRRTAILNGVDPGLLAFDGRPLPGFWDEAAQANSQRDTGANLGYLSRFQRNLHAFL